MKEPKYGEVSSTNLERVKCYISEGLDNFISSWCCKNNVDKSFSLVRANNFKNKKNGEKIFHLANDLYTNKHTDYLLRAIVKNALHNIRKDFIVIPMNKATGNFILV